MAQVAAPTPPPTTPTPTPPNRARFAPVGLVAIAPAAFGIEYTIAAPILQPFRLEAGGKVAIVEVHGPTAYADWRFDCYSSIKARVAAALASEASTVVLLLDTPGGEVAGAFDTARELRVMAAASRKRLVAFTGSQCQSAGYALATAAGWIVASTSAVVGSIGVIASAIDTTRADAMMGVAFAVVGSGERKTDGNPHVPISEGQLEAMRASVDAMAAVFFELVRETRKIDAAPLQAGSFVGAAALQAGLVDELATLDALLAEVATGKFDARLQAMADDKQDAPKEDAVRAALVTASTSDDPEKAKRAKAALAAYDSDEEPKDEKKPDAKAADNLDDPKKTGAVAATAAAPALTIADITKAIGDEFSRRESAREAASKAASELATFKASRPDLSEAFWASVAGQPLDSVKAIASAIPPSGAPAPKAGNPMVPVVSQSAQGAGTGGPLDAAALAARNPAVAHAFGLTAPTHRGVTVEGNVQRFGVAVPAPAKGNG